MPNSPAVSSTQGEREATGTREHILRITLDLIGRDGIGALSNRRIARALGTTVRGAFAESESQTSNREDD